MHYLVCRSPDRFCCYSNSEPTINHPFYNSDLRTRGMYLVINLTVAETLVGVISSLQFLRLQSNECKNAYSLNVRSNWAGHTITLFLFTWFPLTSLTNITVISLDRMHATFRPFRHRVIKKWVYGVTISVVKI